MYGQPQWQQPSRDVFVPTGQVRRPWLRPVVAFGALVVFGGGFWAMGALADDGKPPAEIASKAYVGDCVENRASKSDPVVFTIPCDDAGAEYKVMAHEYGRYTCPAGTVTYYETGGRKATLTLCLQPVRH
ncbi:LppU/SCO3897 family protein [Streptomyces sp. NBC_01304]|uniref:LppU/SCO3897 family protein n=1 Tax=Streptomyces sp. NBC_01304 TaxID=2903818 RepID=UPI002E10EA2C|nr:hypothetical protein OG430_27940 [Streptomyces sp. NBC_01304]